MTYAPPKVGRCPRCDGSGSVDSILYDACRLCGGRGTLEVRPWSESEREILRTRFAESSAFALAVELGRPVSDVWGEAMKLGLRERLPESYAGDPRPIGDARFFRRIAR